MKSPLSVMVSKYKEVRGNKKQKWNRDDYSIVYPEMCGKPNYKVMIIAHRGFSSIAPENTIPAFQKAVDIGADMIELDIYLSKDGIPVVIHDFNLARTTNGKGKVSDFSLEELKAFDAGSWFDRRFKGEKIPSLDETLALAKDKIMLNIEIKKKPISSKKKSDGIEEKAVRLVEKHGMESQVIFSSFNPLSLKRIKDLNPRISTALLFRGKVRNSPVKLVSLLKADALNHGSRFFRPGVIKEARKSGLKVNIYTVNKKNAMKKLIRAGVDGIVTDYPDKLIEVLEELKMPANHGDIYSY